MNRTSDLEDASGSRLDGFIKFHQPKVGGFYPARSYWMVMIKLDGDAH